MKIMFSTLKIISFRSVEKTSLNKVEKIITAALVLNTIDQLISKEDSFQSDLNNLADTYTQSFSKDVSELKSKYTCYAELDNYITSLELPSFLSISRSQVKKILEIYNNKSLIEKFNPYLFSVQMYGLNNINIQDEARLHEIHKNVFSPIIRQYVSFLGIALEDVSIVNVLSHIPCKEFSIKIKNIEPGKIKADIDRDIFNISKYIYKTELTSDGGVDIIIR